VVENDIEHVPPSLGHNNMVELEEAIDVSILMNFCCFGPCSNPISKNLMAKANLFPEIHFGLK